MATPIPKNACQFTVAEIASAIQGEAFGDASLTIHGVSIDTRSIEPGALFVALRGINDGHQYLGDAARRGALAAVVERGRRVPTIVCVEVNDTLAALGLLANYHLRRVQQVHRALSISIGGAAGKTTTKEITAALARAAFGATLSTPGNLNNLIGVPMTLFTLTRDHRAMVIECGTNTRGEIRRLSAIVESDVAMVLNVDLEHSEGLGTLEDIADEEAAIFAHTKRTAVFPADDPKLAPRVPARLRAVTFGVGGNAVVQLIARTVTPNGRTSISVRLDPSMVALGVDPLIRTEIALIGSAAALNCAAAVAATAAAAQAPLDHEQLSKMGAALAQIEPVPGRLATREIDGVIVIDDSYNAQPRSVRIGLEAAREVAQRLGSRLIIALGDMLELGDLSTPAHQEVVGEVLVSNPAVFVAIGDETCSAASAAQANGAAPNCDLRLCKDSDAAAHLIPELVRTGDVLMIKGSRGIKTERIVEALTAARRKGPDH